MSKRKRDDRLELLHCYLEHPSGWGIEHAAAQPEVLKTRHILWGAQGKSVQAGILVGSGLDSQPGHRAPRGLLLRHTREERVEAALGRLPTAHAERAEEVPARDEVPVAARQRARP